MNPSRISELISLFLVNAAELAYVEEAHGTFALLNNLNQVYRYMIRDVDEVTLYNEIDILEKYIELLKMSYGDRFEVKFTNNDENKNIYIKHLSAIDFFDRILFCFLENYEDFISISISCQVLEDISMNMNVVIGNHVEYFSQKLMG